MTVERLLADAEIRDVLARYCRGVDRLDEELVRSCYHDGATDSHGNFEGTVDEFVEWAFGLLRRYTLTMHFLGNILIEPSADDPDVAFAETYAIAYHRKVGGQPHHNLTTAFRYVDRFERRPVGPDGAPEWRIVERVAVSEWVRHDPPEGWVEIAPVFLTGQRNRDDIVYTITRPPAERPPRPSTEG